MDPTTFDPNSSYGQALIAHLMGTTAPAQPNNSGMAAALMNGGSLSDLNQSGNFLSPYASPQTLAANRAMAAALQKNQQPVQRVTQGLSNMFNSGIAGYLTGDANHQQQAAYNTDLSAVAEVAAAARGEQGQQSGAASPFAAPPPAAPASDLSPGFNSSVNRTLGFEGGYNSSDSNGSPSNYGINAAANPGVDVANLTPDAAKGIYKSRYWDAINGDSLPPALARVGFDTAVIAGPDKANELIAQSGGDPNKLLDARTAFQTNLINSNPQKYAPYAQAWQNRLDGLRADVGAIGGGGGQSSSGPSSAAPGGASPAPAPAPSSGAPAAIASAAPAGGSGDMLATQPPGALAFAGPQQGSGATQAQILMGNRSPVGASAQPDPYLIQALQRGGAGQPQSLSPQDRASYATALNGGVPLPQPSPAAAAAARVLASPYLDANAKAVARQFLVGDTLPDSYGGYNQFRPGDASSRNIQQGTHFGSTSVGGQVLPFAVSGRPGGPQTISPIAPNAPIGAAPRPSGPAPVAPPSVNPSVPPTGGGSSSSISNPSTLPSMASTDPLAGWRPQIAAGQQVSAEGNALNVDLQNKTNTLNEYRLAGARASGSLGQLDAIEQAGQKAGWGATANVQKILGSYGIPSEGLGDIQTYEKAIDAYAPNSPIAGQFKSALGGLMTNPQGRAAAVANMRLLAQRQKDIGDIANDNGMPISDRIAKIGALPAPQLQLKAPTGDGSPATTSSQGPVAVTSVDQARALPKGTQFRAPDGRVMVR